MSTQTPQAPGWGPPTTTPSPNPMRNGLGTAAFILGIAGIFTVVFPILALPAGITGLVLGILGYRRAQQGHADNGKLALAGTIISAIATGTATVLIIIAGAILIGASTTADKQATSAAPVTTEFSAPASIPTDTTPDATEPPTSAPTSDLAIGDTGSFTSDDGGAADITVTKIEAATRDPSEFGEHASHGWYVVVHLKATGTSGSYDANSFDFYAKASNGYHAEDAEYLDSWGPALEGGTLHSGEHISGTIVYDMPTRHGKLVYSPNYDGEPLATWSY